MLGGDGSLSCFIDHLLKDEYLALNLNQVHFAAMPFGTGNDISRSLGWGRNEELLYKELDYMVRCLVEGKREKFAFWQVEFLSEEAYKLVDHERVRIN